jgi:hypothetical protein
MMQPLPHHPPIVAPPPKRGRTWIVVVSVAGAALLVVLLPVFGFLVWLYAGPDIDDGRKAADRFARQLERHDDAAAYRSMCPTVRDQITIEQFTKAVDRLGRPVSHTLGRAAFNDEAGSRATVAIQLTDRVGRTTPMSLTLTSEPTWQVCDDIFG